jgi:hypothetical protein
MKKLAFAIVLVALLAAAVVGGQALASSKPADVTVSEEMSEEILFDWGSSYRGYPLRMKTLSDNITLSFDGVTIEENYSGVRHVSLTLYVEGVDGSEDWGGLQVYFADDFAPNLDTFGGQAVIRTYEFDAKRWKIDANDTGNEPIKIKYHATITYPSNQW